MVMIFSKLMPTTAMFSNLLNQVLDSIKDEICVEGRVYSHTYKPGDFIISDNLAVGHEADPATQLRREEVSYHGMLDALLSNNGDTRLGSE